MNTRARVLTLALVAYTAFVLLVTLTPRMPGTGSVAILVNSVLAYLHERGWFLGTEYLDVEFLANIGMFVPLGVLAALLLRGRARWALLLIGTAFSAFIETYQALFLPGRYPELRDIVSNSLGFLLGAGVVLLLRAHRSHRPPE